MIAHALTTLRLLLAAPVAVLVAQPDRGPAGLLAALLGLAMATDVLDGPMARRAGTASARGRLFDHAVDCLFVTAGLGGAAVTGTVPWLLPPLVVVAFGQYVLDSYVRARRLQLRMSGIGRWNGVLYFAPLVAVAVSRLDPLGVIAAAAAAAAPILAYGLIVSTAISMVDRATSRTATTRDV